MSEVPEGWTWASVGDTAHYVNGLAFNSENWEETGRPIIRIQNLTRSGATFNYTTKDFPSEVTVEPGDILVSWSATLDAFIWAGPQGVLNQHIFRVLPNQSLVDSGFLFWGLKEIIRSMVKGEHLHGSTMKHINRGPFLAHPFPLPPLPEQRRIVAKIEALMARSRAAREALADIPPLLDHYRQSVLTAALDGTLTHGLRNELDGSGSIGLPRTWRTTLLGDVVENLKYGTSTKCGYEPVGMPVLRIPNIGNGFIDVTDLKYADLPERERRVLSLVPGDLLMIRSNGSVSLVGKTALVSESEKGFAYAGYLIRLRCRVELITPEFLNLCLSSPLVRHQIEALAKSSSGVNNINTEEIRTLTIPLPPIQEQQDICRRVNGLFCRTTSTQGWVAELTTDLDPIDQSILAKAFRGELVPQDPSDEPAGVLLARIRSSREAQDAPARRLGRPVAASTPIPAPRPVPAPVALDRAAEEIQAYAADAPVRVDLEALDTDALMAAFRQTLATRGSWDSDEDLLRALAQRFGYQRLGSRARSTLKGHLRAALLRRIAVRETDGTLALGPRTLDAYTRDELIACIPSVLRKGQTLTREDLMRTLLHHLGFQRLTDAVQEALKSAINAAIRRGVLRTQGTDLVRRLL